MKHLIGKRALRTAPITYSTGVQDWSYSNGIGVEIVSVTDTHVYIKSEISDQPRALDARWLDGNWVEFNPDNKSPGGTRWI